MAHYMDQPEKTEEERQRERAERAEDWVRDLQRQIKEITVERDSLLRLFNKTKEMP